MDLGFTHYLETRLWGPAAHVTQNLVFTFYMVCHDHFIWFVQPTCYKESCLDSLKIFFETFPLSKSDK